MSFIQHAPCLCHQSDLWKARVTSLEPRELCIGRAGILCRDCVNLHWTQELRGSVSSLKHHAGNKVASCANPTALPWEQSQASPRQTVVIRTTFCLPVASSATVHILDVYVLLPWAHVILTGLVSHEGTSGRS